MSSLGSGLHHAAFLLGTTAPDAFEPDREDSFSKHHFKGEDGRIRLQRFLDNTGFRYHQSADDPTWFFTYGYFGHLWLDVYYRDHGDRLPFKRPTDMPDADLRSLVRKETEVLNAPFVLNAGHLPVHHYTDLALPSGLEFVNLQRCIGLFHEVVKQSQAWSLLDHSFESLDKDEYATFLEDASRSFQNEIRTIA